MFQNYSTLLNLLENDKLSREETYNALMAKEENVLNISSRISTQEHEKKQDKVLFLNITLSELIARFAYTFQNIFTEIVIEKRFDEIPVILFKNDRKFYVGLMLFLISLFLLISQI